MDIPPCEQTHARSSPLQARALQFLMKLPLRGRDNTRSKDSVSPVTIPAQDFQCARSSIDLFRKPDLSRLIRLRVVEDGPSPMDTDDSSQDASPSGNSPPLRPRRHSTWDSLHSPPIHPAFAAHGAAPLLFLNQAGARNQDPVESGNLLASAPSFLRSNKPLSAPVRDAGSSPEIPPQINVTPQCKTDHEAVHDIPPRPLEHVFPHHVTLTNPTIDLLSSTSYVPAIPSRTQSHPFLPDSTSEKHVQRRPALLPHHSAPLPPPFRVTTERGLRLSPSVISRQPIPLLNLPTLPPPPPVPDAPDTPSRQRVRLRSMPSLCRHGRSNIKCGADHENVTLGESDEEDGGEGDEEEFTDALCLGQSDDEDEDLPSAGPSRPYGIKSAQKQPIRDDPSPSESPISPISPKSDSVSPSLIDCFCSEPYVHVASLTTSWEMYPFSPNIPDFEDVARRLPVDPEHLIPGARLESKPSLYRVASRSMNDLDSARRSPRSREIVGSNPASTSGHTAESREESEENDTEAVIGRLLRRTSMPSFHPTSAPPPYPTFDPRPRENRIAPHEDEGREWLPPYSNSLYLIAIMPRKMEFSSPGVQAKDRKWRRVVCELEGTIFRVYKCPRGASGGGVLGDWWEKHVGVGNVAGSNPPLTRKKGLEEQLERPAKLGIEEPLISVALPASSAHPTPVPPVRQRTGSQSSTAIHSVTINTPRPAKRMSAVSFLSPFRSVSTTLLEPGVGESSLPESRGLELLPVDTQDSRSSLSHESTERVAPVAQRMSVPPPPRSATRLSFLTVGTVRASSRNDEVLKPPQSDLLRAYTLQHAESGLGNDYQKRKNVIRVRLEGEQFLLQATDIPAVVEWIEGFHAGTNISLDIDERTMPRGPMFPRRRRRRVRHTEVETMARRRAL